MKRFNGFKQHVSIVMLLIMLLNMIPADVFAADDGFIYKDPGKTILEKYRGSNKDITIPKNVKVIGENAFTDKGIISIKLNEGLETIESEAFSNNKIAEDIVFPSSLKLIGKGAFSDNQITGVDFSKTKNIQIEESAFQDNKISGKLDLGNLSIIPKRAFWNNQIRELILSENLTEIQDDAFANNKLTNVSVPDNTQIGENIFAGNGQYVIVESNNLKSENSKNQLFGHIVNPVNITVRYLEEIYRDGNPTGEYKSIMNNKQIKFDVNNDNNFFALNEKSSLNPDNIVDYTIDTNKHKDGYVVFTPDRDNYIVDVVYKKIPEPVFKFNKDALNNLIKEKKEGSDITNEDLLSLVSAYDYKDVDISQNIKVSPEDILNAESKEYIVAYSVKDDRGVESIYNVSIPVAIDPMKIKIANTEWRLEDFVYDGNAVIDLSDIGKEKAKNATNLAIPHINPHTMDPIEIIDLGNYQGPYNSKSKLNAYIPSSIPLVWGNPETIKHVKEHSFRQSKTYGALPDMPNLEYVDKEAFAFAAVSGKFPETPKLKRIEAGGFQTSSFDSFPKEWPELEYIGSQAFGAFAMGVHSGVSGQLPDMPKVKQIGFMSFLGAKLSGRWPEMPKLEIIDSYAFQKVSLKADLPDLPNLRAIYNEAFQGSNLTGFGRTPKLEKISTKAFESALMSSYVSKHDLKSLQEIGNDAFANSLFSGFVEEEDLSSLHTVGNRAFYNSKMNRFPNMPNVNNIGDRAFANIKTFYSNSGMPNMPKLEYIGDEAFHNSNIKSEFPSIPSIISIGDYAFNGTNIHGTLGDIPLLEKIGERAFLDTDIGGVFPRAPKLKHISAAAFSNTKIEGFPDVFESLETISHWAFDYEDKEDKNKVNPFLKGDLPEMPKLRSMGIRVFLNSQLNRDKPFYINNNTSINADTFKPSFNPDGKHKKITLLTYDGKSAPNVQESDYHELNPYQNIFQFKGVNSKGEELINKNLKGVDVGNHISIELPKIDGYVHENKELTISKNDIKNGIYEYKYKSFKEVIDEKGGNKYQFKFTSENEKDRFHSYETINTKLYLSTSNEPVLKNGKIKLSYNKDAYRSFFITKNKAIQNIVYNPGEVEITLNKDLQRGTEAGIPVSFQFNRDFFSQEKAKISALLYDGNELMGYNDLDFGLIFNTPYYRSEFENGDKQLYRNITVPSLDSSYYTNVKVYPKVSNLSRDFKRVVVEYSIPEYTHKSNMKVAPSIVNSNGWKKMDDRYRYEVEDFKGALEIPPLELRFDNPLKTENALLLKSTLRADINTDIEEEKVMRFSDINEINIFPEERSGYILGKNIKTPRFNGRHSYFYDNIKDKENEFIWDLTYNITGDISELVITDHDLDNRMKYTSINPNGHKAKMDLKDEKGDVLVSESLNDLYLIDENLQEKVASIDLTYYNLDISNKSVKPLIGSKLKNPNKNHFTPGNPNNINKFYNNMSTRAVYTDGSKVMKGIDFAFTDILANNLDLKTEVKIKSRPEDLAYGKTATTSFSVKSKEFFSEHADSMKYTALISPRQRIEDVVIKNGLLATYDISQTPAGYTKIDFDFKDIDIELNDYRDELNLFDIKTTPMDKSESDLAAHGFLYNSKHYKIYNQGSGVLEGLDKSQYSYDKANAKIINGEFLSIRKLIGKDDYVGSNITTKPGEKFFYRFELDNSTNVRRTNLELIDILPFNNDNNNSNYHNTLDVEAARKIKLPDGFTLQYLNQDDFIEVDENNILKELSDANWSNTPAANTKAVKLFTKELKANDNITNVDIPMKTKVNLTPVDNDRLNTNRFAYTHNTLGYKQDLSNPVMQKAEVVVPKKDIKFKKISMFMGEEDGPIAGATFALFDARGKLVQTTYSNSEGNVVFSNVSVGDYIIKETNTPKGHKPRTVEIPILAEELNNAEQVYDLGKVFNHKIDEFNVFFKNVEVIGKLGDIDYDNIKKIYNKEISSGKFSLLHLESKKEVEFTALDKSGEMLKLKPGNYVLKQTLTPRMGTIEYLDNKLEYKFRIAKNGDLFIPEGNGTTGESLIKQKNNMVYFPNTMDFREQSIQINKKDQDGNPLEGVEFEIENIATGQIHTVITDSSGSKSIDGLSPGMYVVRETKALDGYLIDNTSQIIDAKHNNIFVNMVDFVNKELKLNVNKYKIVADNIIDKTTAEKVLNDLKSSTSGNFIIKELTSGSFQVREVWKDNNISINGKNLKTDINGSIIDAQKDVSINKDSVLQIENKTKISGHYEPSVLEAHVSDYIIREDFDGVIEVDIEVKPLKGSIYVSKYVIDKNDEIKIKESVNGSKYALYVDKGKGYTFLEESTISNSNYTVFKDLNPAYKYKVVETFVPDGQEDSKVKEYEVELNEFNKHTSTVIFRNKIPVKDSFVSINKIDGTTGQKLSGVEFTIINKHGISQKFETDSNGEIVFKDLKYDLAPFTIKETKAKDGYRINSKDITVTEEDLDNNIIFTVENYKSAEAPETGTLGKLPFVMTSLILIAAAYILKKRNS